MVGIYGGIMENERENLFPYPSVVLTTLILLICRTTYYHCLGIAKDQTFQYSVLMETGGLAFGEGPNRLSMWRAFTREFIADFPSG